MKHQQQTSISADVMKCLLSKKKKKIFSGIQHHCADKPVLSSSFPDVCPEPTAYCAVTFISPLMLCCMYIQLALHRVGGDWKRKLGMRRM